MEKPPENLGRNWWGVGLIVGFVLMFVVNGARFWFAITNADEIVPSYKTEAR
ncbi:MAG TPA: hypothetical protein PKY30_11635 [Myxococcota bacterium]|nr:hypothetical protein [Myxococcota bacterium]HNH47685.1 hypothetical protein [Myxococcota bacterium]